MPKIIADRVIEISSTIGLDPYTLSGALVGYRNADSVCQIGDSFDYYAESVDVNGATLGEWEVGLGTYTASNTLTRTLIYTSTNNNLPVEWTVGLKRVALAITIHTLAKPNEVAGLMSGADKFKLDNITGNSGTFILDATSTGVVASKIFSQNLLLSCSTDTTPVNIVIGCEGDATAYIPIVNVNGIVATLSESTTKRWFTASVAVPLVTGPNTITATSSTGSFATAVVTKLGGGPAINSIVWGSYPGAQTELRSGNNISVTINTELAATSVTITGGNVTNSVTLSVTNGVATGNLTIGSGSGSLTVTAIAKNSFGTAGAVFTSPTLILNQTAPTFSSFSVVYPVGQGALTTAQTAEVTCNVTNGNTFSYTGVGMTVSAPTTYAATKTVTNTSTGYVGSGTNYTITATKSSNGASASASTLVKIATVAPTASITILGNPSRLISSPAGVDYEVQVTPNQTLTSFNGLVATIGIWQGSWVLSGSYWKRTLRITDADARGTGVFQGLSITGLSLINGSTITSGSTYVVGGMSARTVTFAPFSRVAPLGTSVADQTKTAAAILGGNTLILHTDNAVATNGYYIANADASYNPTGAYIGLSDAAFAGSNTTGLLQATFQESA